MNEGKGTEDWELIVSTGDKVVRTWNEGIGEGFGKKVKRESEYRWNAILIYALERDGWCSIYGMVLVAGREISDQKEGIVL